MVKRHVISVKNALSGVHHGIWTQPNFIIHILCSVAAVLMGFYFRVSRLEWVAITMTISLGLAIEYLNTSIESTVDLITREIHPVAKIAKDTSAAAMLVYAAGSIIVAVLIFAPRLLG